MLRARVITAVCALAAIFLVLFVLPPVVVSPVILLVITGAAWEWSRLAGLEAALPRATYILGIAAMTAAASIIWPNATFGSLLVAAGIWWLIAFVLVVRYPVKVPRALVLVGGPLTLVPAGFALIALTRNEMLTTLNGAGLLLFVLVTIWGADVGAYFAGRAMGKRKLAPHVSPNKTWEGVFGGLALVALIGLAGAWITGLAWFRLVPLCIAVAAISIVGDLTVSLFKREAGIKDSGTLFPGHGGILDRIDSIAAGTPLFVAGIYLGHGPW
ncbi:MAG: phosphatidate cytidylyltransferase [Pseudomonadota bacterium]